ncbi:MAG: glycerol-3-phosphate 1-O-acyltransferase PlsY [Gemmatimonadales bacterium]
MSLAMALLAAYLLGAIPTSYLVAKLARGIDLRTVGSKNLGATNLYRQLGWGYAIPVALFDVAKGAIPVTLLGSLVGVGLAGRLALGAMAVVGHVYSVFVGFRGGKGVATGAGVVVGLAPLAAVGATAVWAVVVKLSGYVSLGSILAAASLPLAVYLIYPDRRSTIWIFAALAGFVIVLHHANIRRLLAGTEHRFGQRPAGPGGEAS